MTGRESFINTARDSEAYRLDLTEKEVNTLQDAARILDRLHKQRRSDAVKAKAEEAAFTKREREAFKAAAEIFDSWHLDVAGWLLFILHKEMGTIYSLPMLVKYWDSERNRAREQFLYSVAHQVASGKGTVEEVAHSLRVGFALHSYCNDLEAVTERVTAALVAHQLERSSQPACS